MTKILVTGGAGFIGSNLIKRLLLTKKFKIICLDNLDDNYSVEVKNRNLSFFNGNVDFKFICGDILNINEISNLDEVDIIIHLAAKAGVRESISNPILYNHVNVEGTKSMLTFALNKRVKKFIFASSSSVYGINQYLPWNEESELCPISPYAVSKVYGEKLGKLFSESSNIQFIALRLFTVYGPGQRPDLAINKFFHSIINNEPITVYGQGNSIRDYTYIDDVLSGIVAAIDYEKSSYEVINIGSNSPIMLNSLITEIENVCKRTAHFKRMPEQAGDVPTTHADISKAKKLLGYLPSTTIREGLQIFHDNLYQSQ
ncbi:UDP-glucuronate 4-epimerase [Pedobacter terrae]|uniref:UDP-glucuronate 4-epimerase n=1 Tax=Pedobacter terrae TaxID=405671 RepID=A0A1G8CJK2_9SPHI|nr:NAD-dependent epimerase/dehydratase family protein [Pedobacter terrae]SDH45661.1 UDP-glucuronate 4-epimerase [Pedobacter terrae]